MKYFFLILFLLIGISSFCQNQQSPALKPHTEQISTQGGKVMIHEIESINNAKSTVTKYDNRLRQVSAANLNDYTKKISTRFKSNQVRIIPEKYVDFSYNTLGNEKTLTFTPIIIDWKPLTQDSEHSNQLYKAKMSFILFSENDNKSEQINNPVSIEVASSGLEVNPRRITIDHVNLPSIDVEVTAKDVTDSVEIRIITNYNAPDGYAHYLKVSPVLQIKPNKTTMQGLGIQKKAFTVKFKGSSSTDKERITITSNGGSIDSSSFLLAYNETKTFYLRSEGLDDINLTASTTSSKNIIKDAKTVIITQKFPWMFLGFALIGGILGALIRFGFEGAKKYPLRMMMGGMLMGIFAALAFYVLEINFLDIQISPTFNEFAVLTFSALCSIVLQPFMLKKRNPT